jgi:hypothetical protein
VGKEIDTMTRTLTILFLLLPGIASAQAVDPFGQAPAPKCTICPPGADGKDGRDGKDGKDGKPGLPGLNGKDGKDGIGRDGKDGRDGRDGSNGLVVEPQDSPLYHFDLPGSINQRLLAVLPNFAPNLRNFLTYNPVNGDISLYHQQPDAIYRETRPGSAGRILHEGLPRKLWVKGEVIAFRANGVTPHWIWLEDADGAVCVVEWVGGYGLHEVLRKRN